MLYHPTPKIIQVFRVRNSDRRNSVVNLNAIKMTNAWTQASIIPTMYVVRNRGKVEGCPMARGVPLWTGAGGYPILDLAGKGPRDQSLGYPQKGHDQWVWTDRHLWKHTFPIPHSNDEYCINLPTMCCFQVDRSGGGVSMSHLTLPPPWTGQGDPTPPPQQAGWPWLPDRVTLPLPTKDQARRTSGRTRRKDDPALFPPSLETIATNNWAT